MEATTGNNPIIAIKGLADAAVFKHGPQFLKRGGPVNRALSEFCRGSSPDEAAAIAAQQGKGHVAELRLASEQTLSSGLLGKPYRSRLNPVVNDPHVDIEVLRSETRVNDAQVGVGSARYLARKARKSRASQVVVNKETRKILKNNDEFAYKRTSASLVHDGTSSDTLSGSRAEDEASYILERIILGKPEISFLSKLDIACSQGARSFVGTFGTSLLYDVVDRLNRGAPFDSTMIERALRIGANSGLRTAIQSYTLVDAFLEKAGNTFRSRLLHAAGRSTLWAGAVADIVVSTSIEIVDWIKGSISFEELLRRTGVHITTAGGATLGVALVLPLCSRLPWWASIIVCIGAGWAGCKIGRKVGDSIFNPTYTPVPQVT